MTSSSLDAVSDPKGTIEEWKRNYQNYGNSTVEALRGLGRGAQVAVDVVTQLVQGKGGAAYAAGENKAIAWQLSKYNPDEWAVLTNPDGASAEELNHALNVLAEETAKVTGDDLGDIRLALAAVYREETGLNIGGATNPDTNDIYIAVGQDGSGTSVSDAEGVAEVFGHEAAHTNDCQGDESCATRRGELFADAIRDEAALNGDDLSQQNDNDDQNWLDQNSNSDTIATGTDQLLNEPPADLEYHKVAANAENRITNGLAQIQAETGRYENLAPEDLMEVLQTLADHPTRETLDSLNPEAIEFFNNEVPLVILRDELLELDAQEQGVIDTIETAELVVGLLALGAGAVRSLAKWATRKADDVADVGRKADVPENTGRGDVDRISERGSGPEGSATRNPGDRPGATDGEMVGQPNAYPNNGAGGSRSGSGKNTDATNGLPEAPSQLGHIFGSRRGHLPDTPENRRLLVDISNNPSNNLGTNRFGNEVHVSTRPDGSQVWVETRGGVIQNGGVNNPPRIWVDGEGLR